MSDSIRKKVAANLVNIGSETGKELIKETGKIGEKVISSWEWLGDMEPMEEADYQKAKLAEENMAEREMEEIRKEIGGGRKVEEEISQLRRQKEEEAERVEKNKEREEYVKFEEKMAREKLEGPGNENSKRARSLGRKGRKSAPDMSQMSATAEFKGKID